jgi:hypothetical protein
MARSVGLRDDEATQTTRRQSWPMSILDAFLWALVICVVCTPIFHFVLQRSYAAVWGDMTGTHGSSLILMSFIMGVVQRRMRK